MWTDQNITIQYKQFITQRVTIIEQYKATLAFIRLTDEAKNDRICIYFNSF